MESKTKETKEKEFTVGKGTFIQYKKGLIEKDYTIGEVVGSGAFASVRKVKSKTNGQIRALKIIKKQKNQNSARMYLEVEILKKLIHPNIMQIFEFYEDKKNFYIITEFCEGGELFDKIIEKGSFSENEAAWVMKQLLSAVNYIHSNNIVHRDLKPENILLDTKKDNIIKIIDWGTARFFDRNKKMNRINGTPYYIAPEVLAEKYDEKCDIWSCGVILYILLCGKVPFNGKNDSEILQKIKGGKYDLNRHPFESVSDEAKDLIKKCLDLNVNRRINARSALNHKWFRNLETKKYFSEVNEFFLHSVIENLISYSPKNKLQEIALTYLVHNFPNLDEIKNINKIYCLLNKSKNGQLTKKEMKKYLSQYIPSTSQLELDTKIESIFSNIDNDNNGFIEFEEFARAGINKKIFLDEKVLHFVFDFIDKDLSGEITLHELKEVFGLQHDSEAEKVLVNLIKEIDLDGNGRISFNEFKYMITHIIN